LLTWGSIAALYTFAIGSSRIAVFRLVLMYALILVTILIVVLYSKGNLLQASLLVVAMVTAFLLSHIFEKLRLRRLDKRAASESEYPKNM